MSNSLRQTTSRSPLNSRCAIHFFRPSFNARPLTLSPRHLPNFAVRNAPLHTAPSTTTSTVIRNAFPPKISLPSIIQFVRTNIKNATHRDAFRGGSSWGRPPRRDWLDSLDGRVIFYGIIAVNVGVFLVWQSAISTYRTMGNPTLLAFMRDNFLVDMRNVSAGRIWTIITACFSHRDTSHAMFNGLTFYFMAPAVMQLLGNKRFLGLYFLGGISASLASLAWNTFFRHEKIPSQGASGAIMATLALYSCAFPRNTFLVFFVIPCPAWVFLPAVLLYDGWQSISDVRTTTDSPGHVGGSLAGIGYYIWKFALRR
ncbi:hypothetical protein F5I97DRAFT_927606 [Phlebopus sp. FC_14]|nr:hypothetical protein F5I97DRAFT_927606 [Phlebopus sp. FC_14]